ncbi:formylglycine-generating enzyme family protein [Novosphingobium gossypii]|uniref:formylglycine-generating enzyme family protein n=1 Tax=Novosphingobium gossypii TaxID=1604774 RepID=UPI003D1D0CAF
MRPDHDITGNVAEWVADCHHVDFIGVPADGSAWLAGPCTLRNVRGAGWSLIDWTTRAAQRIGHPLQQRPSHLGMRLGRDLPPDQIDLRPYSRLAAATMARLRRV